MKMHYFLIIIVYLIGSKNNKFLSIYKFLLKNVQNEFYFIIISG